MTLIWSGFVSAAGGVTFTWAFSASDACSPAGPDGFRIAGALGEEDAADEDAIASAPSPAATGLNAAPRRREQPRRRAGRGIE